MEKKEEKQPRLRSRSYPRYDLEESIKFIQSLQKLGGARVSTAALAAEVKKGVTNSGFLGRISSSKQFGLLTQDMGKLSVSTLGKEILFPRGGEASKNAAIATALGLPDLYKELVTGFSGKIVPDVTTLGNLIAHDYKIELAAKDIAARNFVRSITFAGALQNGILVVPTSDLGASNEQESTGADIAPPRLKESGSSSTNTQGFTYQENGDGWSVTIKSQKPFNSDTKKKLIDVAESLDEMNKT